MTAEPCPVCGNVGGHYPGCPEDPAHVDPPRDYAHNPHAEAARRLKAAFLMDALKASGQTPAQARALTPDVRRALEKAGGVRRASDETWELAARLLEEDAARAYHSFVVEYRVDDATPWRSLPGFDPTDDFTAARAEAERLARRRDAEQPRSPVRYRVAGMTVLATIPPDREDPR